MRLAALAAFDLFTHEERPRDESSSHRRNSNSSLIMLSQCGPFTCRNGWPNGLSAMPHDSNNTPGSVTVPDRGTQGLLGARCPSTGLTVARTVMTSPHWTCRTHEWRCSGEALGTGACGASGEALGNVGAEHP